MYRRWILQPFNGFQVLRDVITLLHQRRRWKNTRYVPASAIKELDVSKVEETVVVSIKVLPSLTPKKQKDGQESKGKVGNSRTYTCWNGYRKIKAPRLFYSRAYLKDGVATCQPLERG
jgi:hypothetical protein